MFENRTGSTRIGLAIIEAEKLLEPMSEMMLELRNKNDWRYDSGTGEQVHAKILAKREALRVNLFRYRNPFSKAIGHYSGGPDAYFNERLVDSMPITGIIANLLHERMHFCGFHHQDPGWLGARRANVKTPEKCAYSVPYFISENVGRWL